MNQAYFHTSHTDKVREPQCEPPVNRDPEIRRRRKAGAKIKLAGVPRGEFDEMMGYLCLCPPAVCRPSALTYSCRPRSSDADNLRIFYFRTHIALVHRRTTSTTSILKRTSSTSFTWTWDGFTATLRSSHGLASSRRWRVFRRPHGRVFLRQAGGAPRHRLSLNAEEYSMVVILRM